MIRQKQDSLIVQKSGRAKGYLYLKTLKILKYHSGQIHWVQQNLKGQQTPFFQFPKFSYFLGDFRQENDRMGIKGKIKILKPEFEQRFKVGWGKQWNDSLVFWFPWNLPLQRWKKIEVEIRNWRMNGCNASCNRCDSNCYGLLLIIFESSGFNVGGEAIFGGRVLAPIDWKWKVFFALQTLSHPPVKRNFHIWINPPVCTLFICNGPLVSLETAWYGQTLQRTTRNDLNISWEIFACLATI